MALILACSPLYSTETIFGPPLFSNGSTKAFFCAAPLAPPKLTTVSCWAEATWATPAAASAAMRKRFFMVCSLME
jgi:hypothetical protein